MSAKAASTRPATAETVERAGEVLSHLRRLYARDPIEVHYTTPFQLIVAVILSAQCTDVRVNKVTATFFDRFKTPEDFLTLSEEQLEDMIRPTGFFRNKAKSILGAARALIERHGGHVPKTMAELTKLPGFGRKTANVILVELHGINAGVCVDTHVLRLAKRLGLSASDNPIVVERDLMALIGQKHWHQISHGLILHGRRVCAARAPQCAICPLVALCPSAPEKTRPRTAKKR